MKNKKIDINEVVDCILDAIQDDIEVEGVFDPCGNMQISFNPSARKTLIKVLKDMELI